MQRNSDIDHDVSKLRRQEQRNFSAETDQDHPVRVQDLAGKEQRQRTLGTFLLAIQQQQNGHGNVGDGSQLDRGLNINIDE